MSHQARDQVLQSARFNSERLHIDIPDQSSAAQLFIDTSR
jgi:hypothetical protein